MENLQSYSVQPGDTLSLLAVKLLGPGHTYSELLQYNHDITDPNRIYPGQVIFYPAGPGSSQAADAAREVEEGPGMFDQVKEQIAAVPVWAWAVAGLLGVGALLLPLRKPVLKAANPRRKAGSRKRRAARKIAKVLGEFKRGKLKTHGKRVKRREQAIAIALRSAGVAKKRRLR